MRWAILIVNLLAVVVLQFAAVYATTAHRAYAYSVYHELVANHVLVEKPTDGDGKPLDVERRLRTIGSGGYYSLLAHIASTACLLSGVVFFITHKPHRHDAA